MTISHFSTLYTAHRMLFLSFLVSLSPLASSRSIYLFVGPVIHYSCRLGLMDFCYLFCQFFVALIIGLSFCLPGLPQMALNRKKAGFEGGEREIDLLVHAHCVISIFSSISSLLSSVFSLIFFLFSFTLLSFYSVNILCFSILFSGHGKGPFIVPAVANFYHFTP